MLDVLLVADDKCLRDLMLHCLQNQSVTVASSAEEAQELLGVDRYALVIMTNFGIPPLVALSVVLERRDYPVLFLTGYMDEAVKDICLRKKIHWRTVPIETGTLLRELRLALDEGRP